MKFCGSRSNGLKKEDYGTLNCGKVSGKWSNELKYVKEHNIYYFHKAEK